MTRRVRHGIVLGYITHYAIAARRQYGSKVTTAGAEGPPTSVISDTPEVRDLSVQIAGHLRDLGLRQPVIPRDSTSFSIRVLTPSR